MRSINLLVVIFLIAVNNVVSQNHHVKIEGQIIGYDGLSPVRYYLSNGNYFRNPMFIQPDSLGRFVIQRDINRPKFFFFHFRNKNEKEIFYECRLILQPGKNYSFICEPQKYNDVIIPHSPDIYSWNIQDGDQPGFYKIDLGQMYYNMFDNGTMGYIYREEWDLYQPDSLLIKLNKKTEHQIALYTELLNKGEIDSTFFEVATLNVKYFNAYRLAVSIRGIWMIPQKFGIKDSLIVNKLYKVYDEIFRQYPVENVKFGNIWLSESRYIEEYLHYLAGLKDGKFSPPERKNRYADIDEIKNIIPGEVYRNYKLQKMASDVAMLQLESSKIAKDFLNENPDMRQTALGGMLENELNPRSEAFDSISGRSLSEKVIFLDENGPIQSFQQLLDSIKNKPIFLNFWGTWCFPSRNQFKYNHELTSFLQKNKIAMLYIANEYQPNRENWKKIIAAYNLEGYHFILTDDFKEDMEKYGGEVTGYPTFMIIDSTGKIVEKKACWPGDGKKLFKQLLERLNL
ncbi:MAG: TlpA family protein disulfide reductase [Mariniphaga sp.]|nr:TlpA family protein disulfide reductase [Mariniphaga sp.]